MKAKDDAVPTWLAAGAAVLVGLALAVDVLARRDLDAIADWDRHLLYLETSARAVMDFGELPSWNPFPCGGVPLLAHPESKILTPFFALYLLFPTRAAVALDLGLHFVVLALGFHELFRSRDKTVGAMCGAVVATLVFAGSSAFALRLAAGHLEWMSAAYVPWLLLGIERGVDGPERAAIAGLPLALMIGEGGTYTTVMFTSAFAVVFGARAVLARSARPVAALALAVGAGALLAAPKLLPMIEFLLRRPREIPSPEVARLGDLVAALFSHDQAFDSHAHGALHWHEYGHYVGLPALALAAVALVKLGRSERLWGGTALLFFVLAIGSFAAWSPWSLLHALPYFRSMHVPTRFLLVVVWAFALLAGAGASWWIDRTRPSARGLLAAVVVAVVATDVLIARAGILDVRCPRAPWPDWALRGEPLVTLDRAPPQAFCAPRPGERPPGGSSSSNAALAGVALVDAYEPLCPHDRPAVYFGRVPGLAYAGSPAYRGEAWSDDATVTVSDVERTFDTLAMTVSSPANATGATVVLNQNWDPGWRASEGTVSRDAFERLNVTVGPGKRRVALAYAPPWLPAGGALGFLGLALVVALEYRSRRGARGAR